MLTQKNCLLSWLLDRLVENNSEREVELGIVE